MALICSISNEVPEQPCVSPASGCIFERRLIEKYIKANGVDPITNQPLSVDHLVDIKTPQVVRPKPPSATSFPALIKSLQDEWDAVMLHSFSLRQQLQTTRQELSHALYQQDASCRVIARLNREVAAAREALATLKPPQPQVSSGAGSKADDGDVQMSVGPPVAMVQPQPQTPTFTGASGSGLQEEIGVSEEVIGKFQEKATTLTADRKKRGKQAPEGLATPEDIQAFKVSSNYVGLHNVATPGILALDTRTHDSARILTAGNDRNAVVSNSQTSQVLAVLKGHSKKVLGVQLHPTEELAFTASADCTARVWGIETASCAHVLRAHEGAVTGLSLHPTGDYLLLSSSDSYWSLFDIRNGRLLCKVSEATAPGGSAAASAAGFTNVQFHPDGLIFGTGTEDSVIKIWDVKERKNVADFPGHSGAIASIAFSENGYYLATAAEDAVVKLWDLRKLKNFRSIPLDEKFEIKSLCFDYSGAYLALAGTDVRVYNTKNWEQLMVQSQHTALATGVRFGTNAHSLFSCSLDRSVKVYEKEKEKEKEKRTSTARA